MGRKKKWPTYHQGKQAKTHNIPKISFLGERMYENYFLNIQITQISLTAILRNSYCGG